MLHILYILAFSVIAFLAISNLIRNLITVNSDSRRFYSQQGRSNFNQGITRTQNSVPHPELLDDQGRPVNEPLLVMRSVSVEEARQQLDQIYNASPSQNDKEQ
jgi:hypothetical protein